jgi:HEPN domain-containing protein
MRKLTAEWLAKADDDLAAAQELFNANPTLKDQICFHCQQPIEKYLKAMLQHLQLRIPYTHDIPRLLDLLLPSDKTLRSLRRGTPTLTRYAVEYRYPGLKTTLRQARAAFQKALIFREQIRKRLGLRTRRTK